MRGETMIVIRNTEETLCLCGRLWNRERNDRLNFLWQRRGATFINVVPEEVHRRHSKSIFSEFIRIPKC